MLHGGTTSQKAWAGHKLVAAALHYTAEGASCRMMQGK